MKKIRTSLRKKINLAVWLLALTLTGAAVAGSYRIYAQTMDEHYEQNAVRLAGTAAALADAEWLSDFTARAAELYARAPAQEFSDAAEQSRYYAKFDALKDGKFNEAQELLSGILRENELVSLYFIYIDPVSRTGLYLIDGDTGESGCHTGDWDVVYKENEGIFDDPERGFPAYITDTDEYGWLCTAGVPVRDGDGRVICYAMADLSMEELMQDRRSFLARACAQLLILIAALAAAFTWRLDRLVIRPINRLAEAVSAYVKERGEHENEKAETELETLEIHTGDEVENLYGSFTQMAKDIGTYIRELTAVTAEKERIGAELDVAARIQADMLPCIFPPFPERKEFDIYAVMKPAREVGGDFYDFFLVDDDHLALVMADVSGKGVPAALFMMIAKTLLKSAAQTGLSPRIVLEKVNSQLCENNDAEMFVTVWLGILEISTGRLCCANAGHEYPAIRRRGGEFALLKDSHGFVLAGMEGTRYREYTLTLEPGDSLFLYTDGVPEATNGEGELFGTKRMTAALNACPDAGCEALLQKVHEDIGSFVGEAPQFDDITMLCLTLNAQVADGMKKISIRPEPGNVREAMEFFERELMACGAPEAVVSQVCVVVDEVFSNIVNYSGATAVTLGCRAGDGLVRMRFSDNGRPYDPTAAPDPDVSLSAEERKIGGLGLFLVRKMMDHVSYECSGGFNALTLEKRWKESL